MNNFNDSDASPADSLPHDDSGADNGNPSSHRQRPPKRRSRVLEGVIGLGLLLGLAGVVGPGVADTMEKGRQTSSLAQLQHVVDGLRSYSRDTLTLPTGIKGRTNVSWLYGPGTLPLDNPFAD
ncbi:MAG: hypothetical protein ACI9EF_003998, partial [Pseudohongiellaceae bacterium]